MSKNAKGKPPWDDRKSNMGEDQTRHATPDELKAIQRLIRQAHATITKRRNAHKLN